MQASRGRESLEKGGRGRGGHCTPGRHAPLGRDVEERLLADMSDGPDNRLDILQVRKEGVCER